MFFSTWLLSPGIQNAQSFNSNVVIDIRLSDLVNLAFLAMVSVIWLRASFSMTISTSTYIFMSYIPTSLLVRYELAKYDTDVYICDRHKVIWSNELKVSLCMYETMFYLLRMLRWSTIVMFPNQSRVRDCLHCRFFRSSPKDFYDIVHVPSMNTPHSSHYCFLNN